MWYISFVLWNPFRHEILYNSLATKTKKSYCLQGTDKQILKFSFFCMVVLIAGEFESAAAEFVSVVDHIVSKNVLYWWVNHIELMLFQFGHKQCCPTPPKSVVKRLGVDFVFTPSQWQSQQWQTHQKRALASNLVSWILVCNLSLTVLDEI